MDLNEAIGICICGMCPSYYNCGERLAFCLAEAGISKCIKSEMGCICPGCPVQEQTRFQDVYYCIYGGEMERSLKK